MRTVTCTALALVLALTAPASSSAQSSDIPPAQTPRSTSSESELDRQVREVSSGLRCVVCQGVSIEDSPSTLAQEMRGVVREQLAAGRSPDQVRAYFVERYGEWVLLRPRASGLNLLVYLLPIAMIAGGAAFIFMKARTWTRAAPGGVSADDAPTTAPRTVR